MDKTKQNLYARLMAKHNRDLMSYIYTLHPNHSEAEDILQELAINVFKQFEKYDTERPFLPWAFRFASYEVLRFRRSKARNRLVFTDELIETMAEERKDLEDSLEQNRNRLQFCVKKLKDTDKQLLQWRYHAGKTVKQMAERFDQPVKRLYKRLERLKCILHKCMITES